MSRIRREPLPGNGNWAFDTGVTRSVIASIMISAMLFQRRNRGKRAEERRREKRRKRGWVCIYMRKDDVLSFALFLLFSSFFAAPALLFNCFPKCTRATGVH